MPPLDNPNIDCVRDRLPSYDISERHEGDWHVLDVSNGHPPIVSVRVLPSDTAEDIESRITRKFLTKRDGLESY